jgi:hypothetical protein
MEAITVDVRQIRTRAVLVDHIVGDFIGTRVHVRVLVVAVDRSLPTIRILICPRCLLLIVAACSRHHQSQYPHMTSHPGLIRQSCTFSQTRLT